MSLEYIRNYYGVPAFLGQRAVYEGKLGTITDGCQYVWLQLDGEKKSLPYHPTDLHYPYQPTDLYDEIQNKTREDAPESVLGTIWDVLFPPKKR